VEDGVAVVASSSSDPGGHHKRKSLSFASLIAVFVFSPAFESELSTQ